MEGENTPQFRKTKIRRAKKPLHLLPQEIIEEILSKLPVKSLLRFRCVSKSWRSSIDSRFFINKRLRKSTQRGVIYNYTINDPNNNHLMIGSTVVGSCNGLLCILKEKSFFLWNPSIRFSIELPKIDLQMTKYGFGWDEENDAYKVFALVSQQNQNQCMGKVYSSRTNSWKTVEHGCLSLSRSLGVFACGKIHWLTKTGREIESFDLKSDVFGMMEGPCDWGFRTWVQERDGCLSVLCDYNRTRLDSWVMKKYGVKESWVLQNTRKAVNYKVKSLKTVKNYIESLVRPVCTSRQDEIEQEQIHAIHVAEGRPKPAPVRQNKRRAAGCGVKVTQESEEIVEEQVCTSVAEGRPKRQHRRRPTRYGDQGTKENPEIEKEQVHSTHVNKDRPKSQDERKEMEQEQVRASIAEGRPKRQNRRRPARYDT